MLREISDDIAVTMKDRLREFRQMIRQSRHDMVKTGTMPEQMLGRAVGVMDTALSVAESISVSLVSQDPAAHNGFPAVHGLTAYFGDQNRRGQRLFHRDMYYLTKEILRRQNRPSLLINESAFAAIRLTMQRRHTSLIATAMQDASDEARIEAVAVACVALMMEMRAQNPLRSLEAGANAAPQTDDLAVFAALCLAIGLATAKPGEIQDKNNLESAMLAVNVRIDQIDNAVAKADTRALNALFAMLITHLP